MLGDFCRFISEKKLFLPEDRVLAAVSGGVDSMVMAELLHLARFNVTVAHVNFGLRGFDSDEDEALVAQWCMERNITFLSRKLPPQSYQREHKTSIQIAARVLRYDWFSTLADQHQFSSILTAHHLDDQVETVLMQLLNGQLVTGVMGIPLVNELVKRPMMFADRNQIMEFALAQNIKWRDDASNNTDAYLRNKIRHHVIPQLKEINPGLTETIEKGVWKARGAFELYRTGLAVTNEKLFFEDTGLTKISKNELVKFKTPDAVLFHLLHSYGFTVDVCRQLTSESLDHIGSVFHSDGFELSVDREFLFVRPLGSAEKHQPVPVSGEGEFILLNQRLTCRFNLPSIDVDPNCACLDSAKLEFPLTWRLWLPGDEFMPLGMQHQKKLSDFLVDEKIPIAVKTGVSVLLSGGRIAWVVGYRISDEFKVSPETERIFRIQKTQILN
jgi:tRNA(Ile)-lysidine synthase